jgi:GNAT superfamily N-acetyltransferase
MKIRLARRDDAPGMARVIVDTFLSSNRGILSDEALRRRKKEWTYEVSARNWQRALAEIAGEIDSRECVYVAEDENGEIAGVSVGCPSADATESDAIGEVSALYVRERNQGQGVGRALVQATAAYLAQRGMTKLHIRTQAANSQSRGFYEKLGGEMIGTAEDDGDGELLLLVVYEWANIQTIATVEGEG